MPGFALFPLFADTRRGVSISPLDYILYVWHRPPPPRPYNHSTSAVYDHSISRVLVR